MARRTFAFSYSRHDVFALDGVVAEMKITDKEILAYIELSKKATPAPWREHEALKSDSAVPIFSGCRENPLICTVSSGDGRAHGQENAELIIRSREIGPSLADKVIILRSILKRCQYHLEKYRSTDELENTIAMIDEALDENCDEDDHGH